MTAVLLHGVPETPAIWGRLLAALGRDDIVTLQLPGFGCPLPEGFAATKEAYVEWLVSELESIVAEHGPVDLVGHDWGGGFTIRLVSTRPDLCRSWVTDAAAMGSGAFEWHAVAKIWQTPEQGEAFFAAMAAQTTEAVAAAYEALGIPLDDALVMASAADETMASAILTLYRSAVDVGEEWSPDFHDIPAPGLALVASEDPYTAGGRSRRGAEVAGARVVDLEGLGHWWMLEAPEVVAPILTEFWDSAG